jgi:AcrR family transcriptional regulator
MERSDDGKGAAKGRVGAGAGGSGAAPGPRAGARNERPRRRSAGGEALSRERIVAAALALVATDGLAGFSLRRLGEALGCEAMSLYHHFPSKQHLVDALVDHAVDGIAMPPDDLPAIERLRRLAWDYRAMAHRYPKLYPLIAVHRLNTPTGVRFIERVLGFIRAIEPNPERAARQFRAFGYYLTGAALDETIGYAKGPSAAAPVTDEYVVRECPLLAQSTPYFKAPHWDATFALGLEALIAGLAAEATRPRAAPAPMSRARSRS